MNGFVRLSVSVCLLCMIMHVQVCVPTSGCLYMTCSKLCVMTRATLWSGQGMLVVVQVASYSPTT